MKEIYLLKISFSKIELYKQNDQDLRLGHGSCSKNNSIFNLPGLTFCLFTSPNQFLSISKKGKYSKRVKELQSLPPIEHVLLKMNSLQS